MTEERTKREGWPPISDRDAVDQALAQEAEEHRSRINRGLDGAHKPEEKFPIEEAEEAAEER
jgi:hypothetical protein